MSAKDCARIGDTVLEQLATCSNEKKSQIYVSLQRKSLFKFFPCELVRLAEMLPCAAFLFWPQEADSLSPNHLDTK